MPTTAWPVAIHTEILREWNKLDAALSLAQEAISLGQQIESIVAAHPFLATGYIMLLRISLSRGELDTALSALQAFECIEEGAPMETLLSRLRKRDHNNGPTPFWTR